jgi:hypothetical protein
MKYRKWIWLLLGVASLAVSVWRFAIPYEMKVSDPKSRVAIDTGFLLLLGVFGIFCLSRFVKLFKADKRLQKTIDNFGKD